MKPGVFNIVGLMSGTSLDGVDIAACTFFLDDKAWKYQVKAARTFEYSPGWTERLRTLHEAGAYEFCRADREYGHLLGGLVSRFLGETGFPAELVASHGHTIFHRPEKGLTVQIGSGAAISTETGLPVVCDFRSADVAQGGQGAPLVPIGDKLLFGSYDACLNLGGFSNLSFDMDGDRVAFDISPVNTVLNLLAAREGLPYDDRGMLAASGTIISALLTSMNELHYYRKAHPKSLGREWLEREFLPLLDTVKASPADLSRTVCEHIAIQVNRALATGRPFRVLVTGGGTHHDFLMERIRTLGNHEFLVPDSLTVDYKEAIVFAFLGLLRWQGNINILRTVTGGKSDICSGAIYRV